MLKTGKLREPVEFLQGGVRGIKPMMGISPGFATVRELPVATADVVSAGVRMNDHDRNRAVSA